MSSKDEAAVKAAQDIANFVNAFGFGQEAFVEEMSRQHRTLQQSFTGLVFAWLQHLAALEPHQYDLRNEASVKAAKKLLEGLDKYDLHLPCV